MSSGDGAARRSLLATPQDEGERSLTQLFPEIVGHSEAMEGVLTTVAKIAPSNCSVLILGESGTGKELIAAAVHRLSSRAHRRFVAINCSAIPDELLEAELFGHEKGAFTGADRRRVGRFALADQGTIFLDEVGDMPARLQAKLLRVLQERSYSSVGSNEVHEVDVRVIAATNKNLEQEVEQNRFRLDLYYRLNVLPIELPALRERAADIEALVQHFGGLLAEANPHCEPFWFDRAALQQMERFRWPGNIRQLQNMVERLFILKGGGKVGLTDLPADVLEAGAPAAEGGPAIGPITTLPGEGMDLSAYIEGLENDLIVQALKRTHFNKNRAAQLLGLNRTTLVERIKKRGIIAQ